MIEAAQIRAARALIDWSQSKLAESGRRFSFDRSRFEAGGPDHGADQAAIDKMRAALEAAGIAFISKNGGGAGVRLREGQKSEYLGWDDLNASNDE